MALSETTISAAMAVDAKQMIVASATGFAIGVEVRMNGEIFQVTKGYVAGATIVPVLRGQNGTVATTHAITSRVVVGTQADWQQSNSPQLVTQYPIAGRARVVTSYGTDTAIALPPAGSDALAMLNGTARAMTLAAPTKDLDGSILIIAGVSAAAHAITITGLAGASLTVATMDATGKGNFSVMAMDEIWVPFPSPLSGTLTTIDVAMT